MQRYFLSLSQPDYYVSTIVKTNLSKCKNLKKELLELIDYFPQGKYFEKNSYNTTKTMDIAFNWKRSCWNLFALTRNVSL